MAATEHPLAVDATGATRLGWRSVIAAAMALPGLAAAQSMSNPGEGLIAVKWLSYHDWQPGMDRIRVNSPAVLLRLPIADQWGLETSVTTDSVSGASPRYHSSVSGASSLRDRRRAADVRLTRYETGHHWALGAATSDENDFRSRALSAQGQWSSDDNNRSWSTGIGYRVDQIGSSDVPALDERRRTLEVSAGVTQVLSRRDLIQFGISHSAGHGFYNDPYKSPDLRPGSRHQTSATMRWNHHIEPLNTTLRTSYRFYRDSFGIQSHTVSAEPVFAPGARISVTPLLRLYSQGAANFYYNPRYAYSGVPFPAGYFEGPPTHLSADQRLSAFGALTLGIKLAFSLPDRWQADLRVERYEQRSAWHLRGEGSRGLAPLKASFVQWGVSRRF